METTSHPAAKALSAALLAAAALLPAAAQAQAQWKPTKPVTIIVPWAAGGATDQVTRLAASELEGGLGAEDRRRQPARRRRLDRHQGGDGRAEGRLHLDRRRGQAARHLPGARHDQQQGRRLPSVPRGHQRARSSA